MTFTASVKELYDLRRFDIAMLMIASLFPLYRSFTNVVMLGLFTLAAVGMYYFQGLGAIKPPLSMGIRYFLVSTGFYLMMIVSLVYSSDMKTGLSFLVANSYLLFYPLLVLLFVKDISKTHVFLILFSFCLACCLYAFYMHYLFFNAGLYSEYRRTEYNDLPFREILVTNRGHPTYVSMWFLFSSLFLIYFLFTEKATSTQRAGILCVIVFLVISSILLSSKITILAFFFSLLVLVYRLVRRKNIVALAYVVLFTLFGFAIVNVSFLRARFIDEYDSTAFDPPVGLHTNSLNMRVGIMICAKNVFTKNWLTGTGIGDAQAELDKCYNSFNTNAYREMVYNSHNNYIWIAITTGVIGLLSFLFMLAFHTALSIRYNNTLFLVFLVFVSICMLPENILSRNHGVVFFSLFCAVLSKQNQQKRFQS